MGQGQQKQTPLPVLAASLSWPELPKGGVLLNGEGRGEEVPSSPVLSALVQGHTHAAAPR